MYAPELDSLWEADLAFVQDVAKENDGVNYLLVVIDVLSKYLWVRLMKNKTACCLLEAKSIPINVGCNYGAPNGSKIVFWKGRYLFRDRDTCCG